MTKEQLLDLKIEQLVSSILTECRVLWQDTLPTLTSTLVVGLLTRSQLSKILDDPNQGYYGHCIYDYKCNAGTHRSTSQV